MLQNSGRIFNQFAEILRHNVVSDKPNAFNKILNLFICKIIDEDKNDNEQVEFQWLEDDTDESLQIRLNDLYKQGMHRFLDIDVTDFSENEKAVWKGIENRFAHLDENGNIISDILVLAGDTKQKCIDILQSHPLAKKLTESFKSAFDETIKILKKYSHPVLEKQLTYCASMVILNTRMMTVHDEILANKLIVPENPKESTIVMWIEYK